MNFKKRTSAEIESAVNNKDYTGGYAFWPWLIYMRFMTCIGFLINLGLGIGCLSVCLSENADWISYAAFGFFGLFAPSLIMYLSRREYNQLKPKNK